MSHTERPNFVVLMCDQQSRSQLGCYGAPVSRTPQLDRLAASAVRFTRAYTVNPLCTPARAGIFTGRLPEHAGAWTNDMPLYEHVPTMGQVFGELGYHAAYVGKWHLDGEGYFGSGRAARGFDPQWWYDGANYGAELGDEEFDAYKKMGFVEAIRERGVDESYCWATRVSDRAVRFLDEAASSDEPFLLVASYDEPHPPMVCPVEYLDAYDPADMPIPETLDEPLEGKPAIQRRWTRWARDRWNLSPETLREGMRHWYACNTFVDDQIGRVLDAVDRRRPDNTVVIYTTDHGDFYGVHGLLGKGPAMYDEIARVPLLVRAPGLSGGATCDSPASTMDIIPTMLQLAGAAPRENDWDGVSLAGNLAAPGEITRDGVCAQWTRFGTGGSFGGFYPIRTWVNDRYKLNVNLLETDELYDLDADPQEVVNLIDSPEHEEVRDRMHDELLAWMTRHRDMCHGEMFAARPWRSTRPAVGRGWGT